MNTKLTEDRVSQAVRDFWKAFGNGSPQSLADFYAPDAILFGVEGPRPEPARLALLALDRAQEVMPVEARTTLLSRDA